MKRLSLFLATNIAILLVLSITLRLLGIEHIRLSIPVASLARATARTRWRWRTSTATACPIW